MGRQKLGFVAFLTVAALTATWWHLRKPVAAETAVASVQQVAARPNGPALVGIPTKAASTSAVTPLQITAAKSIAVTASHDKRAATVVGDYVGRVKPVPGALNPQVASVVEALKQKNHPERVSILAPAPAFDVAAYHKDPEAYINTVVPSRAFQSAAPGPGVSVLTPMGPTQIAVNQDGQVILRVLSDPNAVVTATSLDLGRFDNQLVSQTVKADQNGVAAVSFSPGSGTIADVHIVISSPMSSGSVTYVVNVKPAQPKIPTKG